MIKKLFNPFVYIAGGKSLLIGVLLILLTSVVGFFSNIHFPDVISVKISPDFPLQYYVIQGLLNWVVISLIFYLIAILFSKSKIRILDVFGTQALARFPYLFAAFTGFSDSMLVFSKFLLWSFLQYGEPVEISVTTVVIAIALIFVTLLLTIWMIALMYNAFRVSANLKGPKSVILFVVGLIVSIVVSSLFSYQLIQLF